MRAPLALVLLVGCSAAPPDVTESSSAPLTPIVALTGETGSPVFASAPHPVLTETVNGTTGPYVECYQNSECASDCCVTQNACETCAFGVSVCVPASVCQ